MSHRQDDFPDVIRGFHEPVGGGGLRQRKRGMNDRPHAAGGEQRPDIAADRVGDQRLLRHRPGAQSRAGQRQTLAQDRAQIDFGLGTAEQGYDHDAPLDGGGFHVAREVAAAHQIEDHIDPLAAGLLFNDFDEVLGAVIDAANGAETLAGARLIRRSGRGEYASAQRDGELDGGGSDAAGTALNQHGIALLAAAAVEQIGPYGKKRFRYRRRFYH